MMIKFSLYFSLWMGASALAWATYVSDETRLAQTLLAAALFWTFGLLQRWKRISLLGAILFALTATLGIYRELPFGWMFSGALFSYLAYNLDILALRIRYAAIGENTALISRVHLTRLGVMTLLGLTLSSFTMLWQKAFGFAWTIFLILGTVWGVSLLVGWVRQGE